MMDMKSYEAETWREGLHALSKQLQQFHGLQVDEPGASGTLKRLP